MYPTTLTSWASIIASTLDDYGIDSEGLFEKAGLDISHLYDPDARYPFSAMTRLWNMSVEASGDPCFGLSTINHWHPTIFHAFGYAWLASNTLKEALERTVRYIRIVNSAARATLTETAEGYIFQIDTDYNNNVIEPSPAGLDAGFATLIYMCRISYGDDFLPVRIEMKRPYTECAERYSQYFNAQILYSSEHNRILFDKHIIEKQLPTANVVLAHNNDNIVSKYMSNMDKDDIVMQVKSKLIDNLASGQVTEKHMAELLNLSLRSLQRKLKEHNVNYKSLLNETRKDLAMKFIRDNQMSISEIAYLLGFSEQSNFSRAFKRWTGYSPNTYRRVA